MLLHHAMKWGKNERNNITDEGNEILLNLFSKHSHLGSRKKWHSGELAVVERFKQGSIYGLSFAREKCGCEREVAVGQWRLNCKSLKYIQFKSTFPG